MSFPSFSVGEVLTAADMNAVGLWKINNTALTGTGGNIANTFPSAYKRFRIVVSGNGTLATATSFYLQLRTGTTTAITNYDQSVVYETLGAGPLRVYTAGNGQWEIGGAGNNQNLLIVDLFQPNVAAVTVASARGTAWGTTGSFFSKHDLIHTTTTAYESLAWSVAGGTFTGNLTVFGYRD